MATLSIDDTRSYNYQWLIENPKQFFLETIQNQVDLESYTAGEYLYRITIENTGLIENYILIDEGFINVVLKDIDIFKMLPKEYDPAMYGTSNTLIYSLPKLNVPKSFVNALGKDIPEEYVNQFVTKAEELTGCTGDINLGIGCLKLKLTEVNNQASTKISDNSFQPSLYSVVMKDFPKFDFASSLRPDPSKEYTYEGTLIKDYGAAIGEEIFFMKWDEARPTVTVKDVETITDAKEITVKPGIINLKLEKPEDLQNKVMTISLKGNYFTGENKRYIKIVKYDSENTLRGDKTGGNGTQVLSKTETTDVTEDKYKSLTTIKTIIDFTDESKYEPDKYYGIFIYLTDSATKPVARGMFKVYNMPFVMRIHHQDHLGTDRLITDLSGNIEHYNETLAYGELVTDPLMNGDGKILSTTGYTGHEHDFDTELINMQARLFNPRDPVFLTTDPGLDYSLMDPMSLNLYNYTRSNPIKYVDPTGKWDEEKRSEMREKLKQLKTNNKAAYVKLMKNLKGVAQKIDSGNLSNDKNAKDFVKFLDKSGLVAAFEDKNGDVQLGSITSSGPSYLYYAGKNYNAATGCSKHFDAMDNLSEKFDHLSGTPIIGPIFSGLSGWFGMNGSINRNQEVFPDKKRGKKIFDHTLNIVSAFAQPSAIFDSETIGLKFTNRAEKFIFDIFVGDKIDEAVMTPIRLIANETSK